MEMEQQVVVLVQMEMLIIHYMEMLEVVVIMVIQEGPDNQALYLYNLVHIMIQLH